MSTAIKELPKRIDASLRTPWQVRALTIVDAIILNVVILGIGRLAMGEFPSARVNGAEQTIDFVPVIVVTVLAGLAAAGLLALLERMTSRATSLWTAIALVVLALSLFGPLGSGTDTSSKILLTLLHIGAAAPIIALMRRSVATRE